MAWKVAFVMSCLTLASNGAGAEDLGRCVSLDTAFGQHCDSRNSLTVTATNSCQQPAYVKGCAQNRDGTWACGSEAAVSPSKSVQLAQACYSSGRYKFAACSDGASECGFPDPEPFSQ